MYGSPALPANRPTLSRSRPLSGGGARPRRRRSACAEGSQPCQAAPTTRGPPCQSSRSPQRHGHRSRRRAPGPPSARRRRSWRTARRPPAAVQRARPRASGLRCRQRAADMLRSLLLGRLRPRCRTRPQIGARCRAGSPQSSACGSRGSAPGRRRPRRRSRTRRRRSEGPCGGAAPPTPASAGSLDSARMPRCAPAQCRPKRCCRNTL
mmetsp:Transcript_11921/g.28462  ORF Transcript_11921/g.28462 Transcript_11921/m.28462 type:complete len:208 (+) Transcript_11921:187-810(+)